MSEHLCLAPLLESYFRRRLAKQRNATPATMASYRDALRMLILFAAARLGKKPAALVLEELDRDLVLAFLDELEEKRNNSVATRNARLAAVRSFFHHVAADDPAAFGIAQRVLAIPTKRAHIEVTHHLTERRGRGHRRRPRSVDTPRPARSGTSALPGENRRPRVRSDRRQRERSSLAARAPAGAAPWQGAPRSRRSHSSGSGAITDGTVERTRARLITSRSRSSSVPTASASRASERRTSCGELRPKPSRQHRAWTASRYHRTSSGILSP